jgi:hypothetical protein
MDTRNRWNDELLDAMRGQGDPAADEVIESLFAHDEAVVADAVLETLVRGDDVQPAELPPELHDFLARSSALPPWADVGRLRVAVSFFEAHAPEIGVILACYSLPAGHAIGSGREARRAPRRDILRDVLDTARSVGDLMADGALEPGGDGIEAAQRIRLRRAALRHRLEESGASSMPLDQESMAGWLMSFSHVVLDGLQKLGIRATGDEAAAYIHAWNVAGHLMGLRSALLPSGPEEAEALWRAVQRRHFPGSREAQAYATALIEMMEDIVPHDALDALPSSMMRYFMGDAMADGLAVPASAFSPQLFKCSSVLVYIASRILDDSPLVAQIARRLGAYFRGVERWHEGDGAPPSSRRPVFSLPPAVEDERTPLSA